MAKKLYTPKVMQAGAEYGIAHPDVPLELDEELGKKLVKGGNWVEGLTDRAKKRRDLAAAAAEEKAKADAEAAEKAKADAKPTAKK